jgi:hypothetical protein
MPASRFDTSRSGVVKSVAPSIEAASFETSLFKAADAMNVAAADSMESETLRGANWGPASPSTASFEPSSSVPA